MWQRLFFAGVCVFWVGMNYLLWRSQAGASKIGNETPVKVVWEKILTAPDNSSLNIFDHDRRIGYCHWTVTSGEGAAANRRLQEDYAPEEGPPEPTAYALEFDGNVTLSGTNRARFDSRLNLTPAQQWSEFRARVSMKPTQWEVQASAASKQVTLRLGEGGARWERTFTFAQLENPQGLLEEAGGPMALLAPGIPDLAGGTNGVGGLAAALHWQAHEDHLAVGHSRVRVYRLETQWMGQRATLFVSLVGEILWVELPNGIMLRNDAFDHI